MGKEYKYTQKEEDFCQNYILLGVQIEAFKKAYKTDHMKEQTIASKSSRLFNSPKISARILALREEISTNNQVTIMELVGELANMIRFDPADMYDEEGKLKSIHQMPKPVRQMIASLDVQELFFMEKGSKINIGEVKKVKLMDKLGAIEKLMKHLGAYDKHNKQKPGSVVVFQLPDNKR